MTSPRPPVSGLINATANQTDPFSASIILAEEAIAWDIEGETSEAEERSLLRDHATLPSKYPRRGSKALPALKTSYSALQKTRNMPSEDTTASENNNNNSQLPPTEHTPLLGSEGPKTKTCNPLHTASHYETTLLLRSSAPLILTFLLQYSLPVASIFTIGHIGRIELGAVSLASMTASITGYAVYQGLATSLDTLAAQAYGSGRPHLVGLQFQRMLFFLWTITVPISCIWACGPWLLSLILPEEEKETARLAGLYLRILIAGAPAYAAWESGKRFLQAQSLFSATTYILLLAAPLNAFLSYFLVWQIEWGFIGAPIAVVVTENLLPLLLFLYVRFVDGHQCWGGWEPRHAFRNWAPMVRLALPGLITVLAEFLAYEALTLSASWLGQTTLAAQSVLGSILAIMFQIPFSMSVVTSTRVANLIGAGLAEPAKVAAKVATAFAVVTGMFNLCLLLALRNWIPRLFTGDEEVVGLVARLLPLCAAFQLFDAVAANFNGILRGLGRQEIGGYVGLFSYYVVGLPISFGTGFGAQWGLYGLWTGPSFALSMVAAIGGLFICKTSWERAVRDAENRNLHA